MGRPASGRGGGAAALVLATGLAAALAPAPDRAAAAPQVPAFSGEVQVQELGLVFEPPARRSLLEAQALDPRELLVGEDGLLRRVTRVEEGETRGSWTVVVWVDAVLAGPETRFAATLALGQEARRLAELGAVEIVVAAPAARTLLAPTREARRIQQALADLAGAARVERDRSAAAGGKRDAGGAPPAAVRRQCDRLLARLAGRRDPGPRALLWVTDGGAEEGALRETGRLLAAYRWVALPLPVRRESAGPPERLGSDADRSRQGTESGLPDQTVPPLPPPRSRPVTPYSLPVVAELYVSPDLAPLRALVEETAGHLVGFAAQLAPALDALAARWQLWIERPGGAPAPDLHRLEATTIGGRPLRTFRWTRTATPPALAEARLRALLADGAGRDPLPASLARERGARLELDLARLRPAGMAEGAGPARAARPFRVSTAIDAGEGSPALRHDLIDAAALGRAGWRHTVPLPDAPAEGKVAVLVEDLAAESWAGAVVYL